MKLLEHQGKQLLAETGIAIPQGVLVTSAGSAARAAHTLARRIALKSQVLSGKRGKAGGIMFVDAPDQVRDSANRLLGMTIGGSEVEALLVEDCVDIGTELYAAVLNDPASKGPLVLFSAAGGMDIEEVSATTPEKIRKLSIDVRKGLTGDAVEVLLADLGFPDRVATQLAEVLMAMYRLYRDIDADLVEINPLVITDQDDVLALDCKISLDPGALPKHAELVSRFTAVTPTGTELERQGGELGLHYIELDGNVGILANGAGLTMTTLDAVTHYGGRPANFLEIGGDAYTKATPALRLVLSNPRVRSLLVNFCGAFARTDVMAEGVVKAIEELRPEVPVFFTIHGTGEAEAIKLVRERLGAQPYDAMDDAVKAAVAAAAATSPTVAMVAD